MDISLRETNVVFQSVRAAVSRSNSVSIVLPEIRRVCSSINVSDLTAPLWEYDLTRQYDRETRVSLFLLFNSLNFCFWGFPRWSIEYNGRAYTGSYGMMAALVRSLEDGVPILEPTYLANFSRRDAESVFRGNTTIQLLDERVSIVKELGCSLASDGIKSLELLFPSDLRSPQDIVDDIVNRFQSFDDTSELEGLRVCFYKRAQLLVAQCMEVLMGPDFGRFAAFFTAFADYRLPQALRSMGVIHYSNELSGRIERGEILASGSPLEIEIRCSTIWAAELIRRELKSNGMNVNSLQIDSWLWKYARKFDKSIAPHHKVRTIHY